MLASSSCACRSALPAQLSNGPDIALSCSAVAHRISYSAVSGSGRTTMGGVAVMDAALTTAQAGTVAVMVSGAVML